MKRHRQITSLIALTLIGLAGIRATAEEPKDKPQPKLVQAKKAKIQAVKPRRSFGSLLQKGQLVTLYRLRQVPPNYSQYQVRIVTNEQVKRIEDVVAVIRKELEDYQSKKAAWEKQMQETTDRAKQVELRQAREELRRSYDPRRLPMDLQSADFYKISDVGGDYVGFERNGVETFHRLSSIHTIIRGVENDQK